MVLDLKGGSMVDLGASAFFRLQSLSDFSVHVALLVLDGSCTLHACVMTSLAFDAAACFASSRGV